MFSLTASNKNLNKDQTSLIEATKHLVSEEVRLILPAIQFDADNDDVQSETNTVLLSESKRKANTRKQEKKRFSFWTAFCSGRTDIKKFHTHINGNVRTVEYR